ncbi:MAG: hypothetical protein ABIB41_09910, partial [Nitrospirota bacterium]
AEGPGGWANINYTTSKEYEDGERISTSNAFFRNLYLSLEKPVTPLISYQLYFRTNWADFRLTDSEGNLTKTYQRVGEPAFDLFFRNPIYDFSAGYRRREEWSTAHLNDEGRETTEFYYSRLNITPQDLPFLSFQFDRQKDFDYLSPMTTDTTDTRYTVSSWYQYLYKDLNLSYNITYIRDLNENHVGLIEETKGGNFTGLYNVSYAKSFWSGKANVSANYQGNYIRNKIEQSVSQTGSISFERTPLEAAGRYAQGTAPPPDTNTFDFALTTTVAALSDNNFTTEISTINIGTGLYHNIGLFISSGNSVDTLFVYVNQNVSADTNLNNATNWRVYRSNSNATGTWQSTPISSVTVFTDTVNNIFRYEIRLSTSFNASFFKAVNMQTVNAPGITNVLVTEIEAYGTEVVSETGRLTEVNNFFNQGINLVASLRPLPKLTFALNYFINRSDQNPISLWNSLGGVFSNIFTKSINDDDRLISNVVRTYGATSTWLTHRLLTTTLRLQRNEAFDNREVTDFSSNTYSLSFGSVPLPTLDTNLSLIRSDNYTFGEKDSTNDSVLLSIVSKLYKDVNMVTDATYTKSKSYITDTQTDTTAIRASIDTYFTRKLYGNFLLGLSWTSSEGTSIATREGTTLITYRPGRFINITGSFRISDIDGDITTSEGILMDWLPLPALRLNLNYLHTHSEVEPLTSDSLGWYGIWYITKFLDLQLTYVYTRTKQETDNTSYNIGANLNCRFW